MFLLGSLFCSMQTICFICAFISEMSVMTLSNLESHSSSAAAAATAMRKATIKRRCILRFDLLQLQQTASLTIADLMMELRHFVRRFITKRSNSHTQWSFKLKPVGQNTHAREHIQRLSVTCTNYNRQLAAESS